MPDIEEITVVSTDGDPADTTAVEGLEPGTEVTPPADTGTTGPDDTSTSSGADDAKTQQVERLKRENQSVRAARRAAEEAAKKAQADAEQALQAAIEARDKEWKTRAAKALGLVEDEPALTPEQVAERITAERDQARKDAETRGSELLDLLREVAVQDAAAMHDAQASRLTDSRRFMAKVTDLDATDRKAFRAAVAELVKAEVEADPDLSVQKPAPAPPAATASGGTTTAGTSPRDPADMTVEDFMAAGIHRR